MAQCPPQDTAERNEQDQPLPRTGTTFSRFSRLATRACQAPYRSSLTAKTPNSKQRPQHGAADQRHRAGTAAAPINPFCAPRAAMTATKLTAQIGGSRVTAATGRL
jgi:hypothetical protein